MDPGTLPGSSVGGVRMLLQLGDAECWACAGLCLEFLGKPWLPFKGLVYLGFRV